MDIKSKLNKVVYRDYEGDEFTLRDIIQVLAIIIFFAVVLGIVGAIDKAAYVL